MVELADWIGQLPDDTRLTSLSIPGTHNSAACHTALPSVQCQDESVLEQLRHGVRFLDVRVGKYPFKLGDDANDLTVVHGKFPVRIPVPRKFSKALAEIYQFLEEHSREVVILLIKQEGTGEWNNDADEFANVVWDKCVSPNKDKWFLGTEMPRIGDARGKIVLFRRFGVNNDERRAQFGFDAALWKYNTTDDDRGAFCVQDFCEIQSLGDIPKKADYVKDMVRKAVQYNELALDKLFVNFTSGSNFFDPKCWPEKVADGMLLHNIEETFGKGSGIVVLDYINKNNWKLSRELVERNF